MATLKVAITQMLPTVQQIAPLILPLQEIVPVIQQLKAEIEELKADRDILVTQVQALAAQVETLERKDRAPNAILYGVEEGNHTAASADQLDAVKSLLDQAASSGIVEIRRLGKFTANAKPRPIIIRFASVAHKHAAFKHAKTLKQAFKAKLDDDLTPTQRECRKQRMAEALQLQQAGWTTFWRGEHLFKVKQGSAPVKVPKTAPSSAGASAQA
jgi:hypothetical protein